MVNVPKGGWKECLDNKYIIGAGEYGNLGSRWVEI
jgi:hypothetical protein